MQRIVVLVIGLLIFDCIAHSGRTDSRGGHNCSAKSINKGLCSGYHYHSGSESNKSIRLNSTNSSNTKFNRKSWPHWADFDNDCQNARTEILIRDSVEPVKFKRNKACNVSWGKWIDPYTLQTFTKASDIDIDHIIPLAHAHKSGAANWSKTQKRAFANDPENLLAVEDNVNQQKSARAPHEWMPMNKKFHCIYLRKWRSLKAKYKLTATKKELYFITNKLRNCS